MVVSRMDRALELQIVDELLDVLANQTVDLVDTVREEPVTAYTDPELWSRERKRLFQRTPVVAALSAELPDPGSWKLFDESGIPIVLIRGDDGIVRGFLNVCGHRGARLVDEDRGQTRRLSCPFHGWSYKPDGSLVGVPRPSTFAGVCLQDRALRPVQVAEHLGMVWVVADPAGPPLDLPAHLGAFAEDLSKWDILRWRHLETRTHDIPANWKIVTDTFTEGYHIPVLHKGSVGPMIAGGLNAYRAFGDHQREVFAMKNLEELREVPREQRNAFAEGRIIFTYDIYPNTILQIGGDHAESYRVFPGEAVGSSMCVHSYFTLGETTDDEAEQHRQTFDFFYNLVGQEDFKVAAGVQKGLHTGAYDTYLYGRMEPATQVWHAAFQRDTHAPQAAPDQPVVAIAGS